VDPYGDIYICPASIGRKELITGNVYEGINEQKYASFFKKDPVSDEKCRKCDFLPLCFGSCRLISYFRYGDFNRPNCEPEYFRTITPALLKLEVECQIE
jgi:uncharacterized protein